MGYSHIPLRILRMQISCRKIQLLTLIAALFSLVACESNPSHRPPIGGAIGLVNTNEKGLCFLPKFETAYLTSTKKHNDLKFINLSYVDVVLGNDPLSNKTIWQASPNSQKYYKLEEGESICMNDNLSGLKKSEYANLTNDKYTVVIGGMDDTENYNLRFIERFEYPIQTK